MNIGNIHKDIYKNYLKKFHTMDDTEKYGGATPWVQEEPDIPDTESDNAIDANNDFDSNSPYEDLNMSPVVHFEPLALNNNSNSNSNNGYNGYNGNNYYNDAVYNDNKKRKAGFHSTGNYLYPINDIVHTGPYQGISINDNTHVCLYSVCTKNSLPILFYLLQKNTDGTYGFPTLKVYNRELYISEGIVDNIGLNNDLHNGSNTGTVEKGEQVIQGIMNQMQLEHDTVIYTGNISINGSNGTNAEEGDNTQSTANVHSYLFYEKEDGICDLLGTSDNTRFIWATIDEIINHKKIMGNVIEENTYKVFAQYTKLMFLENETETPYEIPMIVYRSGTNTSSNFEKNYGIIKPYFMVEFVNRKVLQPLGDNYTFFLYEETPNNRKLLRYALFPGKTKVLMGRSNDPVNETKIIEDGVKLLDMDAVKGGKLLDMEHEWILQGYDSAYTRLLVKDMNVLEEGGGVERGFWACKSDKQYTLLSIH
jgi:hypothetical protein